MSTPTTAQKFGAEVIGTAILAAVEATLGSDLDAVAAAAARAVDLPKLPQD